MKSLWNWLRRGARTRPARSHQPVRPQLEQLDERLVPSATSAVTTYHPAGVFTLIDHDLYAIDQATQQAVDFRTGTFLSPSRTPLGGPRVSAVSASVDPATGYAEVFARATDGSLWLCDSHGAWHDFGGWYKGLSATRDGHVYAVTGDGSDVRYLDSAGGDADLGAPNDVYNDGPYAGSSLAAGVGWFGSNEVFAIGPDGAIYVNSVNAPGYWRQVDGRASFQTLSATPNDEVFALDSYGHLYQESEHVMVIGRAIVFFWSEQDISNGMTYRQISADRDAAGKDEVYAIAANNSLYLNDQGSLQWRDSDVAEVSGADGGYFFDVNYPLSLLSNDTVWAWDPYASSHWTYLGQGVE